jgi:hypothetical protein
LKNIIKISHDINSTPAKKEKKKIKIQPTKMLVETKKNLFDLRKILTDFKKTNKLKYNTPV